MTPKQSCT